MDNFDGITDDELLTMWENVGKEHFTTFEEFKIDYINHRKKEKERKSDNIERHNWLYSIDN